jgi:hypothetical protein
MQFFLLLLAVIAPILHYIGLHQLSSRLGNYIDDKYEPSDQEGRDFKAGMKIARQRNEAAYGAVHIDSVN